MLMVPQRSKVQGLVKDAKNNVSLKGRSFPDGEETWHLFANWLPIAKSLRLTPHVTTTVEDMGKLLAAIYRWTYDPFVQGCAQIAKRFQNTICPHKRLPYLLWLRNEGTIVLGNLQPWGGGMFCGDIVDSLNYVFKDNFLTTGSREVVVRLPRRKRMRQCSDMRTSAPSSTRRCLDGTGGGNGKMST